MNAVDTRWWFAYNRWATERLLTAAEPLSPEALGRDLGTSFGSLAGTFQHLLSTDTLWLRRLRGLSPLEGAVLDPLQTVAALRHAWEAVWTGHETLLPTLGDEVIAADFTYRNSKGMAQTFALGDVLYHVLNHATYHRGQIAGMLRQLGTTPPSTDFLVFASERRR